jgi:hypothetical protein
VGLAVEKVALRLVFFKVLRFSPLNIIPPLLHIHSCIILGMNNGAVGGPVSQRQFHLIAAIIIKFPYIDTKMKGKFC